MNVIHNRNAPEAAYIMEYIDNWTMGLDIKILFQTIWVVLTGKGSK